MTDTTIEPTARAAVMGDNSAAMDVKTMVKEDPRCIFRDTKLLPLLLAQLDKEIEETPVDVTTKKGRDDIRTRAADIGRLKSMLDKTGLALTEDFRKQTKEVNDVRSEIKEGLTARDDKAREKLTDWERAEDVREAMVRDARAMIEKCKAVPASATLVSIASVRGKLVNMVIDEATFGELATKVMGERVEAYDALDAAEAKIKQDEADKAELARLRQQDADRQLAEAKRLAFEDAARIAREEEERVRQEAADKALAEEREKVAAAARAEQAERDRLQKIRDDEAAAVERTRREAEAAERQRLQNEADEARKAAAKLETEKAERERLEREAEEEQEKRLRDRAHRARVIAAAVTDLMEHGNVNEATANAIVQAVAAGSVRHMKVEF